MNIVVLAGGFGGARFLRGVREVVGRREGAEEAPDGHPDVTANVTAVVNTADDVTLHGLRICPDLDTVMYSLGDGLDSERGWGRSDEGFRVIEEIRAYGVEPTWFGLGDRDIATHLIRTQLLSSDVPLSTVTAALCDRWRPGVTLLPMSDDRVETHVVVDAPGAGPGGAGRTRAIHFQEWWVRHRAQLKARDFVQVGNDEATLAPGVEEALSSADAILLAPSNPVVSMAPILRVPGMLDAIRGGSAPVVGISPLVGGRPVRGMAEACLDAIGVAATSQDVGRWYGSRADDSGEFGLLDGWVVDEVDGDDVPGVAVRRTRTLMTDLAAAARLAEEALALAGVS